MAPCIGGIVCILLLAATWIHNANALHPCTRRLFSSRPFGRISSSQRMVLTTPEAIFEQASTTTLLDDLIDESVRTSARRPIMLQFDPSSGWIWKRWKGTIFSETWDACVSVEHCKLQILTTLWSSHRLLKWSTPASYSSFVDRCRK